jgi:hypothetical protein
VIDALGMSYARWENLKVSIELEMLLRNLIVLFTMQPPREQCVNLRSRDAG